MPVYVWESIGVSTSGLYQKYLLREWYRISYHWEFFKEIKNKLFSVLYWSHTEHIEKKHFEKFLSNLFEKAKIS